MQTQQQGLGGTRDHARNLVQHLRVVRRTALALDGVGDGRCCRNARPGVQYHRPPPQVARADVEAVQPECAAEAAPVSLPDAGDPARTRVRVRFIGILLIALRVRHTVGLG